MGERIGFIIISVCLLLILIIGIRKNIFRDIKEMQRVAKISAHNVDYQLNPDRSKPLISMEREMTLQVFYPGLFKNFDKNDWKRFWNIVFGTFPSIDFENEKLPDAQRNLYIQEAQEELGVQYPALFGNFTEENWKEFWQVVFGIKRVSVSETTDTSEDSLSTMTRKAKEDERLERKLKRDTEAIDETVDAVRTGIGY